MEEEKEKNHRVSLFLTFLAYEGADRKFSKNVWTKYLANYYSWIGRLLTVWGPVYNRTKSPDTPVISFGTSIVLHS